MGKADSSPRAAKPTNRKAAEPQSRNFKVRKLRYQAEVALPSGSCATRSGSCAASGGSHGQRLLLTVGFSLQDKPAEVALPSSTPPMLDWGRREAALREPGSAGCGLRLSWGVGSIRKKRT